MKARYFVEHLTELIKNNNSSEIRGIIDRMEIIPEAHQVACKDELSFLIHNYQMDGVEIGKLSFYGKYKMIGERIYFTELDMDLIGLDSDHKEIIMSDHDEPDFIMMNCAKDQKAFLELLFHYTNHIFKKITDPREQKSYDLSELCTIAGGERYEKFVDYLFS